MRFVETPIFTEAIEGVLDHDGYRTLQLSLILRPEGGAVVRGAGGLRKLRWALPGKGKRGGCRINYFWDGTSETFYMLYAYRKSEEDCHAGFGSATAARTLPGLAKGEVVGDI